MVLQDQRSSAPATPELILDLARGFMASKHLFVANEVGLFAQLAEGPLTLDALAERCGIPRRTARISADAMVSLGLLEREGNEYRNGATADAFLSGQGAIDLRPLLRFWNRISYPTWLGLEEAVRRGQAPNRQGGGFSEEDQRIFSEGVEAFTAGPAGALATTYDFSSHRRLMDLGGGTGSVLLAVLGQYPQLRGTLFELPGAAAVARRRLEGEPEGPRIEVVAGDLFQDPLPREHDVMLLVNVIHLFLPDHNRELFRRARAAAPDGARLLIVDLATNPTHTEPTAATLMAGEFLVIAGEGDVYSAEELRALLEESGWRYIEWRPLAGPTSLIVAEAK